jgi:undecaprenyl diphosphate synthase
MLPDIQTANGRFVHLGRKDRVPQAVRDAIEAAEAETAQNTGQVVCLGIDYGAEDQELRAMEKLLAIELPKGTEIAPELLKRLNDTHLADGTNIPPIDLVFRTSGQQRLSGLPNADYAELCTIAACLPDATIGDFVNGLVNYSGRERRFGGNCATK